MSLAKLLYCVHRAGNRSTSESDSTAMCIYNVPGANRALSRMNNEQAPIATEVALTRRGPGKRFASQQPAGRMQRSLNGSLPYQEVWTVVLARMRHSDLERPAETPRNTTSTPVFANPYSLLATHYVLYVLSIRSHGSSGPDKSSRRYLCTYFQRSPSSTSKMVRQSTAIQSPAIATQCATKDSQNRTYAGRGAIRWTFSANVTSRNNSEERLPVAAAIDTICRDDIYYQAHGLF